MAGCIFYALLCKLPVRDDIRNRIACFMFTHWTCMHIYLVRCEFMCHVEKDLLEHREDTSMLVNAIWWSMWGSGCVCVCGTGIGHRVPRMHNQYWLSDGVFAALRVKSNVTNALKWQPNVTDWIFNIPRIARRTTIALVALVLCCVNVSIFALNTKLESTLELPFGCFESRNHFTGRECDIRYCSQLYSLDRGRVTLQCCQRYWVSFMRVKSLQFLMSISLCIVHIAIDWVF